jgi:hypothetical protein
MLCGKCLCIIVARRISWSVSHRDGGLGDEKAWPHLIVVPVVWFVFSDILLQLNLSGEMAGITGVDHELNSALPIPPWTLAIPATFAKSLGVCVLRVNG